MHATVRSALMILPAAVLLAACSSSPEPTVVAAAPAPPPAPVVTAPAYSGTSVAPMPGAMRLSSSDALGLLSNNTAVGLTDNGTTYHVYFASDGTARLREVNAVDTGTWRVMPDGEVCSQFTRIAGGTEHCYVLSRVGDVILYGPVSGPAHGSIRVVSGNPLSL